MTIPRLGPPSPSPPAWFEALRREHKTAAYTVARLLLARRTTGRGAADAILPEPD